MKLGAYIDTLHRRFSDADLCYAHGTDNAYDEACYLVFAELGLDWAHFDALSVNRRLSAAEVTALDRLAQRRIEERIPTAYLVGSAWFAGRRFHADRRALVPRSPIAELIENHFEPLLKSQPGRILDLCCGGGCIGIAAAFQFPDAAVDLADISGDALSLAQENVELHRLQARVDLVHSDLFSALAGRCYDLIVCNPPYVGSAEIAALPGEFLHEPRAGLESADQGLQLPLRILEQAADFLAPAGVLVMEVGYSHPVLSDRFPDIPFLWLDFDRGGEGVLAMGRQQLDKYRERFS